MVPIGTCLLGLICAKVKQTNHIHPLHEISTSFPFQLPHGEHHDIHTMTDEPSCYMYIFVNTTETELHKNLTAYNKLKEALSIGDNVGEEHLKFL